MDAWIKNNFPYGLNDRVGDEFKTDKKHINVTAKFSSLPRKYSRANRGKNYKAVPRLLPQQFWKDLNHMLNANIKDAPNFIRISISSMKKSYLKITYGFWEQTYVTVPLISYFLYITIKP